MSDGDGGEPLEVAFRRASSGRKWSSVDEVLYHAGDGPWPDAERQPWAIFRRSEFCADLEAGRRVVRLERAKAPGDWSATETVTPPSEFWQPRRWRPSWRDGRLTIIVRARGVDVEYINGWVTRAHDPRPPETHSQHQGRPTQRHLYLAELERRAENDEMSLLGVGNEAEALHGWLTKTHPKLNPGTPKTIENNIRQRYRELQSAASHRPARRISPK